MPAISASTVDIRSRFAVLLLAAMACLPFVSVWPTSPVDSFYAELVALVYGLAAIVATLTLGLPSALPRSVLLPATLTLLIAQHALLGRAADTQLAQLAGLYLVFSAALMVCSSVLAETMGRVRVATALAFGIVIGALWNGVVALAQAYGFVAVLGGAALTQNSSSAYGNLGQSNHLADYCALGVLALLYLRGEAKLREWYFVGLAAVLIYAIGLSASRAGWVYVVLIGLGALMVSRGFDTTVRGRLIRAATITLVVFGITQVCVMVFPAESANATNAVTRFRSVFQGAERWRIWQGAWQIFLNNPWLGLGYGHFAARFFEIAPLLPAPRPSEVAHNAHNLLLHIAAEFGLPGLAVLLGGAYVGVRGVRTAPLDAHRAWLVGVVAIIGLHSLLEYPLWYAHFLGLLAVAIGMTDAARLQWRTLRSAAFLTWAALIIGWFVLASTWLDYRFLAQLEGSERAQVLALGTERIAERLLHIERGSLFRHYAMLGFDRTIEINPQRLADKLTVSTDVMRVMPMHDVAYRHALLLALSGQPETAKLTWDRAAASYPMYAGLWVKRARQQGSPELANLADHAEAQPSLKH